MSDVAMVVAVDVGREELESIVHGVMRALIDAIYLLILMAEEIHLCAGNAAIYLHARKMWQMNIAI